MLKLATPISTLFKNDSLDDEIISRSCCLECREESLKSKAPKQYIFHFDKDILHPLRKEEKDFIRSAIFLKEELKLVTFHMSASCSDPVLKENMFYYGGVAFSYQEMLVNVSNNIRWLRTSIGNRSIEIAVENNNYYPLPSYRYITDASFIKRVVLDNQLGFVFDLPHAKITAHNKKESYQDYIAGLPLDRMVQVHVSKHRINEQGLAYDAHELPDESLFQEVKEIIRNFSLEYITIEYYKNKDSFIRLLKEYSQLCIESKKIKI